MIVAVNFPIFKLLLLFLLYYYLYYSLHWALYRSVIEQRNKATQILMYLYQKATYYIVKIWT